MRGRLSALNGRLSTPATERLYTVLNRLSAGIRKTDNWRRLERFVLAVIGWLTGRASHPKRQRRSLPSGSARESCQALSSEGQARESIMGVMADFTVCSGNPASQRRAVLAAQRAGPGAVLPHPEPRLLELTNPHHGTTQDEGNGTLLGLWRR